MRDSVPYPLVEEHHAADGRCCVDRLPRGGRDTAVRRTALSVPPARLTPVHASSIGCPEYVDSGRPLDVDPRRRSLSTNVRWIGLGCTSRDLRAGEDLRPRGVPGPVKKTARKRDATSFNNESRVLA